MAIAAGEVARRDRPELIRVTHYRTKVPEAATQYYYSTILEFVLTCFNER